MKIGLLRKIYPLISNHSKNIKWRSLTDKELDATMQNPQMIANCFDEATRYSLLSSTKGRDLLKKRIKIEKGAMTDQTYKIRFNVDGKDETYRTTKADYWGKYYGLNKDYNGCKKEFIAPDKPISLNLGVSIAISKMVSRHPSQKPLISRLYGQPMFVNRNCEFNRPSNAFKWLTGIEPTNIGEKSIKLTLKSQKKEALQTLNELGNASSKDYSFVALSGHKKTHGIPTWHCLPVIDVNNKNKTVTILNKRTNKQVVMSFDKMIDSFKALVGINWKNQGKV